MFLSGNSTTNYVVSKAVPDKIIHNGSTQVFVKHFLGEKKMESTNVKCMAVTAERLARAARKFSIKQASLRHTEKTKRG